MSDARSLDSGSFLPDTLRRFWDDHRTTLRWVTVGLVLIGRRVLGDDAKN